VTVSSPLEELYVNIGSLQSDGCFDHCNLPKCEYTASSLEELYENIGRLECFQCVFHHSGLMLRVFGASGAPQVILESILPLVLVHSGLKLRLYWSPSFT
jgi:hypothetical protein